MMQQLTMGADARIIPREIGEAVQFPISAGDIFNLAKVQVVLDSQADRLACDASRAKGERSGRKWGTGHR
eukprot:4561127-Pyramimonas_sp.AAC.1